MAKTDSKKLTDEELLAQFDTLGSDDNDSAGKPASKAPPKAPSKAPSKPAPAAAPAAAAADDDDDNPFADLNNALKQPRTSATISRPDTPSATLAAPSSTATSVTGRGKNTPPSSGRSSSEDRRRATEDDPLQQKLPDASAASTIGATAGSWWGGISNIVSGARKQAEAAYKDLQNNEDAQKWAEQVKGNTINYSSTLRSLGAAVGSRALPTFQSLLHTIAPPISQHERLAIHTTHDLSHYPSLDPLIYATFSRVMAQVEGGDLIVIQRGSESRQNDSKSESNVIGFTAANASAGWSDGPWWRDSDYNAASPRNIGAVKGLVEGTKLARVSAESYATEFFSTRGGVEEAARQATEVLSESNPTRSSDIFLAIQAVSHIDNADLFAAGSQAAAATSPTSDKDGAVMVDSPPKPQEVISFAVYLHDPIHSITFSTLSQNVPQKWIDWLDAAPPAGATDSNPQFPAEILEILNTGGVDPREWVAEWVEEVIALAVGIVAQRYVARRMGVGENGMKGKKKVQEIVESGAGEAARAL